MTKASKDADEAIKSENLKNNSLMMFIKKIGYLEKDTRIRDNCIFLSKRQKSKHTSINF